MGAKKNKKLGEICHIVSGGTPSRSNLEYWDNGNIPWIKIGDIKGKYINSASEFITRAGLDNSSAKLLKKGTILYTIFATLGEVGILNFDACTNQAIAGITIKEDINVLPDYLYYYLKSIKNRINKLGRGVAQNNINLSILKNLDIVVIEVKQQKEIIKTLDCVDSIIRLHKKELELLDTLIKARFVEMFGDPVANPMNWSVKKLKDLSLQISSGSTPKGGSANYVEEGITFFRSQNVWKDRLEMNDIAYIDNETHHIMKKSSLKNGDILMTKTGRINTENSSLGRAALYTGEDDMANVNGHVYFIRLKKNVNNKFVLRILVSPEYRDLIRNVCVGGIDKRQLNKEHIEEFPIICPPSEMIDAYINFVQQIDKLRFGGRKRLTKAKNTKNNNRNTITLERSTLYGK